MDQGGGASKRGAASLDFMRTHPYAPTRRGFPGTALAAGVVFGATAASVTKLAITLGA